MKEHPILFSGPMVRAILEDRKTQTRRVESPRNSYEPGDRLWVRETWGVGCRPDPRYGWRDGVEYRADEAYCDDVELLPLYSPSTPDDFDYEDMPRGWRPSIHMPRWASRITLEVTGVRVERLQDICGYDARSEGIDVPRCDCEVCSRSPATICTADQGVYIEEFRDLWNAINGKRPGCSWDDNPRVRVVEFRRLEWPEDVREMPEADVARQR